MKSPTASAAENVHETSTCAGDRSMVQLQGRRVIYLIGRHVIDFREPPNKITIEGFHSGVRLQTGGVAVDNAGIQFPSRLVARAPLGSPDCNVETHSDLTSKLTGTHRPCAARRRLVHMPCALPLRVRVERPLRPHWTHAATPIFSTSTTGSDCASRKKPLTSMGGSLSI